MAEEGEGVAEAQWSNLPYDLLQLIAIGMGLIDFLCFRSVCKNWYTASSQLSPEDESLGGNYGWFLLYGREGSECSMLGDEDKIYTLNLPQLHEATCLACYKGWMLVFRHSSLFFFCPFSKAKIDLPECPFTEIINHVAVFSTVPTSQDCVVAVVNRIDDDKLELYLLRRGKNQWISYNYSGHNLNRICAAIFYRREFHFLDDLDGLVKFNASKENKWNSYRVVVRSPDRAPSGVLRYTVNKNMNELADAKTKLGLDANSEISICGTRITRTDLNYDILIRSESVEEETESETRNLKGLWIQPRYFYVPPELSW